MKTSVKYATLCMLFLLFGCKKPGTTKRISEITTKPFHNLEMIEYCLPIPTNYNENQAFLARANKAQHQFNSVGGNPVVITFKGTMLNVDFSKLQETIERQLENMNPNSHDITRESNAMSYSYVSDGKLYFEKKWLVESDFTVTATISQPQGANTDWFNRLKALYQAAEPICLENER